nr:MAG TPA: hypothetical protein [Caudoviricetes sp.]DAW10630.1 MAG TPA: hypothetical protein [Caudoviricetes sp.]
MQRRLVFFLYLLPTYYYIFSLQIVVYIFSSSS